LPRKFNDEGQLNVFYNHESPHECGSAYKSVPKDFFHLSLTYRQDGNLTELSDEFIPATSSSDMWDWDEVW
jgi:hypothetical protein